MTVTAAALTPQNYLASVQASVPKYQGLIPYPEHDVLGFEFSEHTKIDAAANPHDYISQYAKANERLDHALATLQKVKDEPLWKTANGNNKNVPLEIWGPIMDAKRTIAPFKAFGPDMPHFDANEVPRFAPDGTMLAADEAIASASPLGKMAIEPGANTYVENLSVRWPASSFEGVDAMKFAQARAKLEEASRKLTWAESKEGVPDVDGAIKDVKDIKRLLAEGLNVPTDAAKGASVFTKASNWFHGAPPAMKGVAIGGALLAAGGVAYLGKKALD